MGTGIKATFATQLTDTSAKNKEGLGQHRYEGGRWYKYIKYDDGAGNVTVAAGDFVGYFGPTGPKLHTVTGDTSVGTNRLVPAGLTVSAPKNGEYAWIQIKGPFVVAAARFNANVGDGDLLHMDPATDKLAADGTAAGSRIMGVASDESAGEGVLDCPW